jgi:hypothetical protein
MSNARLDRTKVPPDLWARRIWVPQSGAKPSLVEAIGGLYLSGGKRSGFYVLAPDGSLGEYLGRNKPDLRSMRGTRV